MWIESDAFADTELGASIAVNGACLTVAELQSACARFDLSPTTLSECRFAQMKIGDKVNIEAAVTLQTPLGGHLVYGHIDGIGQLRTLDARGEYVYMEFAVDKNIGMMLSAKSAVAIDGVSMTVNGLKDSAKQTNFNVMVVPHTLKSTNLAGLKKGAKVHIEVDALARHALRLFEIQNKNHYVK